MWIMFCMYGTLLLGSELALRFKCICLIQYTVIFFFFWCFHNEKFQRCSCPLHRVLPSICPHVIERDPPVRFSWSWIFGSSNKICWLCLPTGEDTLHEDILSFVCVSCEVFFIAKNVSCESCSKEWKMFCFQYTFPVLLFLRELNRRVWRP